MAQVNSPSARPRATFVARGGSLVLDNAEGTVIEVDRGCLWLTLQNDTRDIILVAGMRFEIDRTGRTVIVAEQDTCVHIGERPGTFARATAWLKRVTAPAHSRWAERNVGRVAQY